MTGDLRTPGAPNTAGLALAANAPAPALGGTTITSGVAKVIDAAALRYVLLPMTFSPTIGAAATALIELSPNGTNWTSLITEVAPAASPQGVTRAVVIPVPANWRIRVTLANATLSAIPYW